MQVRQQNIDADALLERLDQYTLSRYSSTARKRPPLHDIILAKQSSEQDTVKMKLKLSEESQSEAETRERRNSVWPMTNFYEIEEELVEITWDHWQIDTDPKARCIQPLAITHQQVSPLLCTL